MTDVIKLTAAEAKALTDGALDTFATSLPDLVVDYLRIVRASEDAETMRRAIELAGKLRGIAAEKQTIHLPTVNISFGAGMVISSKPAVEVVDSASDVIELEELCEPVKDPLAFIKMLPTGPRAEGK